MCDLICDMPITDW